MFKTFTIFGHVYVDRYKVTVLATAQNENGETVSRSIIDENVPEIEAFAENPQTDFLEAVFAGNIVGQGLDATYRQIGKDWIRITDLPEVAQAMRKLAGYYLK